MYNVMQRRYCCMARMKCCNYNFFNVKIMYLKNMVKLYVHWDCKYMYKKRTFKIWRTKGNTKENTKYINRFEDKGAKLMYKCRSADFSRDAIPTFCCREPWIVLWLKITQHSCGSPQIEWSHQLQLWHFAGRISRQKINYISLHSMCVGFDWTM